jgi:hypothetical protein
MKQNLIKKIVWLCVVMASFTMVASAQFEDQGYGRDKLANEAMLLLDKIELDSPRSHADLVKLREKINAICESNRTENADIAAPLFESASAKSDPQLERILRRP